MYLIIAEFSDFRLCFYWTACSSQGQRTICQFVNLCDILPSSPQFFETDTDTIKKWKSFETERFQNRNVTLCFHCHVQTPIFTFTLQAPNFQQKPRWIWARKEEVQMLAKNVMYTQPALSRFPFRQKIISNLKTKKHKSKFENLNLNWFLHETIIHAKFSAVFGTRGFSCS